MDQYITIMKNIVDSNDFCIIPFEHYGVITLFFGDEAIDFPWNVETTQE